LLFLRLESLAVRATGEPEPAVSASTVAALKRLLRDAIHKRDSLPVKAMEELCENLGHACGDIDQWGAAMLAMFPEWFTRPETCTGTASMPGTDDRMLQYRRRAKRGKSVFNANDMRFDHATDQVLQAQQATRQTKADQRGRVRQQVAETPQVDPEQ
jgi:hypothetical protein